MAQDLLAPPKVSTRTFAKMVIPMVALVVIAGATLAAFGLLKPAALAWRIPVVLILAAVAIGGHARLMKLALRTRPERMPWIHATLAVLGLAVAAGGFALMFHGTFIGKSVTGNLWMVPGMFGFTLAAGGVTRRVGKSRHCPRCEYEFNFDGGPETPIRCPECGTGWLGNLKQGRKLKSPRMIALGVAIALFTLVVFNPIFWLGWAAPFLPTPVLVGTLYVAPSPIYGVWDELTSRSLSESQIRTLAQRILAQRREEITLFSPSRWFLAMMAAGKMPPDLVERFHREGFVAELVAPPRVKVGQPFTVRFRVLHCAQDMGSNIGIVFAGYGVNPGSDADLIGRQNKTAWGFQLGPGLLGPQPDTFPASLTLDRPGRATIRVVYWVSYQPSFWDDLAWQPDGTPKKLSQSTWFQRVELEAEVIGE